MQIDPTYAASAERRSRRSVKPVGSTLRRVLRRAKRARDRSIRELARGTRPAQIDGSHRPIVAVEAPNLRLLSSERVLADYHLPPGRRPHSCLCATSRYGGCDER
jgi:hypothetical protein